MNERTPEEIARALINHWMFSPEGLRNVENIQTSISAAIQSERDRAKAELELVKKQRDEAVAAEALATSRLHHAKEVSKTVWETHEKQFAEVTAERDRLRAALEGVLSYIDDQIKVYPWCCSVDLYEVTNFSEFKAAREALKGTR